MWRPALAGPVAAVVLVVGACSRSAEPEEPTSMPALEAEAFPAARLDQPPGSTLVDNGVGVAPGPAQGRQIEPEVEAQVGDEQVGAHVLTEVAALLEEVRLAWVACSADPAGCHPLSDLATVYADPLLGFVAGEVAGWAEKGWAVRPPLDAGHNRSELLAVDSSGDPRDPVDGEIEVRFCDVDGRILVHVAAAPDGGDVVLDDSISSVVRVATVRRSDDGRLRVVARRTEERLDGGQGCDR